MDMWHLISGRKSTIKDKWIRGNPKSQLELNMWQVRGHLTLTPIFSQPVWEGKREKVRERERKKEKERAFRERISHFSLYFPTIGLLNPGEIRGKVDPHCKSYAWVPVLWSFDKLREVGVFSYLIYSLAKSHFDG